MHVVFVKTVRLKRKYSKQHIITSLPFCAKTSTGSPKFSNVSSEKKVPILCPATTFLILFRVFFVPLQITTDVPFSSAHIADRTLIALIKNDMKFIKNIQV